MTSGAKAAGRFGKQDFIYLPDGDAYRCTAGERLTYRYANEEDGNSEPEDALRSIDSPLKHAQHLTNSAAFQSASLAWESVKTTLIRG